LELASYGAKMNPRSIEIGMFYNVPILVASSFSDAPGTLIHAEVDMNSQVGEIRNKVRGVATDTNVGKVTVRGVPDRPGLAAQIFEPLADADVSVDVIVQNASIEGATDLTFTVMRPDLRKAREVVMSLAEELGCREVVTSDRMAKVSIVGTGMQNAPGYASRMFRALADRRINIEMITTSEIRITCIVDESNVAEAARVLHTVFDLDLSD
jgi:aspartate kinase